MEQKYSDAFKAGLKFGLAVIAIYLIFGLIGVGISHTPAMVSYQEKLTQYSKEMFNQTYDEGYGSYGAPYTYSHPMPQPPQLEYYLSIVVSVLMYGTLLLGLLGAGIYAIRKSGQVKFPLMDVAYIGGMAGLGSLVDIVIAMVLLNVVNYAINGNSLALLFNMMPHQFSTLVAVIAVVELACCCLPLLIVVSVILSCIGAGGYVLLTGKLESKQSTPA